MIGDRWPRLTGPGVARAEQLIARLEVTLPAGVWTPVSRVDLTPDFFAVLEASIAAVSMHLGPEAARWLRAVADRAASWRGWFGECRAAHSHELAETVLRLLDDLPGEALHGLLEAEPELTCDEAADILADWLVTAVELGQMAAADRLRDRIALLDAARRTTVGTALLAHSLPGMSEDVRARMRNLLGTDSVADFVDRVETIRHGSLEALLAAQEELIDRYRAAGDPDTEDLIRRVRIQQLPLRLAQAVGQGDEAYRQLIASEPLFAAPDAITSLQRALSDWPPDLVAWHTREVRMQADPLLKAEREGTLSEAQRTALMHLQDGFLALCRATSWTERAALLCAREELRTETAILWAYSWRDRLLDRAGVDDAAVAADVEQMDEIIGFLERCGQAAPHVALCEMLAETCGTSRSERIFASLRLLTHLPARYARELESSRDDYLTRLDEAAREPGLTPADLAEIEAHIARYHLARYQTTRTKAVDLEQAIEHWRRALALCADDGVYAAQRRHDLGNCLLLRFEFHGHTMTDLAEAMSLLQDALGAPLPDAFRGPVLGDYARALTMRQEAYGTDEDLVEAINLLEEAIRITPEDSEHWIGWHLTLGGALGQWAEVSHQPEFLRGAIGVFAWMTNRAQPGSELWFWLSHNVAQSLLDYGRSEGAIDAIDAAIARLVHLTTCAASDPFLGLAHCALGRGWRLRYDLGREVGNLSRAVASFARAIELLPTDSPDLAFCLNGLALALDRLSCQGDSGAAEALRATYDRVLAMPWSGSWPHHIIDLAGNYGRWLLRQPDLAGARLAFERGIEALEWMRQTAADPRDALGYGEKHALFLAQLVHCCLELDDPASALKYACAAKARALAMQVARGVLAGVEADPRIATWQAEAADVRERLNYLRGLLRGEIDGHGRVLDAMVDGHIDQRAVGLEIRGLQTRESDLSRLTLRAGARDLPAGEAGLGGLDVARLQEQLGRADAVLVEYAQTLSGWGAFVVTANRVAFVPLPTDMPSWGIWRSRLRLARLQELPSEHLVRGVLRSIYDVFLAPVVDLLPAGKPLVLAPSGMMAMFPLAAAMRPDGRPMLDERPIVIVPSAAYLDVSAQRRYERVLAMSHVGVPGTPSFIPLADIEADLVGAAFHQAMRLAGDGLTPEGAAALASQVDVLHFACHGALDMEHPEATGMILPNGGYLNVLDLFGRISLAGASLAVLSACDVGTELPRPGDEHVSLVRGFLVAGVPAVVASLWPANDLSTMLLMTRFYGILHEGRGVAEALGAAQRWLRNLPLDEALAALKEIEARLQAQGCDEESLALFGRRLTLMFTDRAHPFAHPHHWASFQAYGAAL
jgi:CHAT domain-containing protein/tetratricopeptide (TPR) repeat protein